MHPPVSSFPLDISTYQHVTATSTQKTRNQLLGDAAYLRRMRMYTVQKPINSQILTNVHFFWCFGITMYLYEV